MLSAREVVELLGLRPLAREGGFFRETYRSTAQAPDPQSKTQNPKSAGTAIYYLLTPDTFSALHRLPFDEIFHFYLGDPVTMLQLHPDGSSEIITLGTGIERGECVQVIVHAGTWQGSFLATVGEHDPDPKRIGSCPSRFALMGTTVAPGYDPKDYEAGDRQRLIDSHPAQRDLILRLTRP